MQDKKITIIINKNPYHFDESTLTAQDLRHTVSAPADHEVWQIVHNPDKEGQLPVDDIQVTAQITVKSGDRFRVVPPGTFGGQ